MHLIDARNTEHIELHTYLDKITRPLQIVMQQIYHTVHYTVKLHHYFLLGTTVPLNVFLNNYEHQLVKLVTK